MSTQNYKQSKLSSIPLSIEFASKYDDVNKTAWFKCFDNELILTDISKERYEKLKEFLRLTALCFRVDGWNAALILTKSNVSSKTKYRKIKQDDRNIILEGLGFYLFDDI